MTFAALFVTKKREKKKSCFMFLFRSIEINTYAEHVCFHYPKTSP